MQQGQILVNKDGEKRKILFVSGDLVVPTEIENFEKASPFNFTKTELLKLGWSLLEEPWKPKIGEVYWVVFDDGGIGKKINYDNESDRFSLMIGNYARTPEDAEVYRQKLIERMGRKE